MKITPSLLAADIFEIKNWINQKLHQGVKKFHVDLIDPAHANATGMDYRILYKLREANLTFDIHYMAAWNKKFIERLMEFEPRKIFFHEKDVQDKEFFYSINGGVALEIGCNPKLDCHEYLIMHVKIGHCSQEFDRTNLLVSQALKNKEKYIIADGGINPLHALELEHYDELVVGHALNHYSVQDFYNNPYRNKLNNANNTQNKL